MIGSGRRDLLFFAINHSINSNNITREEEEKRREEKRKRKRKRKIRGREEKKREESVSHFSVAIYGSSHWSVWHADR
jgi:hypothetical protein